MNDSKNTQQEKENIIPESILEIIKREEKEALHALSKSAKTISVDSSLNLNNKHNQVDDAEKESLKSYSQLQKEVEEGKKNKNR